jgi:hypothetical protein
VSRRRVNKDDGDKACGISLRIGCRNKSQGRIGDGETVDQIGSTRRAYESNAIWAAPNVLEALAQRVIFPSSSVAFASARQVVSSASLRSP